MHLRHHARALVALAAAYAVALQAILLAVGAPIAGAGEFTALPICSTLGSVLGSALGAGHSAPADRGHDCLGACLAGCCCGAAVGAALAPSLSSAPAPLPTLAAPFETTPVLLCNATGAHRSRAPPL